MGVTGRRKRRRGKERRDGGGCRQDEVVWMKLRVCDALVTYLGTGFGAGGVEAYAVPLVRRLCVW